MNGGRGVRAGSRFILRVTWLFFSSTSLWLWPTISVSLEVQT